MPQISDAFRAEYEPLSYAILDLGVGIDLLDQLVADGLDDLPEPIGSRLSFMVRVLVQLHKEADSHLQPLWIAAGGRTA